MRGPLGSLLLAASLAGCGSQTDTQLEGVKTARSVLAEWALVEEQAAKDRTPATYTRMLRKHARDELQTAQQELKEQPAAARLIDRIVTGSPTADALHRADAALEPLEKQLESA